MGTESAIEAVLQRMTIKNIFLTWQVKETFKALHWSFECWGRVTRGRKWLGQGRINIWKIWGCSHPTEFWTDGYQDCRSHCHLWVSNVLPDWFQFPSPPPTQFLFKMSFVSPEVTAFHPFITSIGLSPERQPLFHFYSWFLSFIWLPRTSPCSSKSLAGRTLYFQWKKFGCKNSGYRSPDRDKIVDRTGRNPLKIMSKKYHAAKVSKGMTLGKEPRGNSSGSVTSYWVHRLCPDAPWWCCSIF